MKKTIFQKTLEIITNYCQIKENRTNSATTFLQSTCAWACYIQKNWVYVNLDRITKSCPWPTFKVQCWWEKDVFLLGNFFVSILWIVFWILPRSSQSIQNTPDSFLFRWSDLTWTAGQNLGTFLENKSH